MWRVSYKLFQKQLLLFSGWMSRISQMRRFACCFKNPPPAVLQVPIATSNRFPRGPLLTYFVFGSRCDEAFERLLAFHLKAHWGKNEGLCWSIYLPSCHEHYCHWSPSVKKKKFWKHSYNVQTGVKLFCSFLVVNFLQCPDSCTGNGICPSMKDQNFMLMSP